MKKIVVLGAGYAGLRTVKELIRLKADAQIVLVNKNDYHYESTQLHEIAAGTKEPDDITFKIMDVISPKVHFVKDEVLKIDRSKRQVQLKNSQAISYDYLVNCLGFESETFGIKGADEFGLPLIDVPSALAARKHLEKTLANYSKSQDENDLHIIVCGAGFTSIEYLGELVYRLPELIKKYDLPKDKIKIYCVEAGPKILPMLRPNLAKYAIDYLEKHGVEIHTNTPITEITANSVLSKDLSFTANTIIWTTGVKGSHVIADSGYQQHRNRVAVSTDLSLPDDTNEFVIGDVSAVPSPDGRFYPTTGQISIAEATLAAKNIVAKLQGKPTAPFVFNNLGTVCSLGPFNGVAELLLAGHWHLKGLKVAPLKRIVNDRSVLELAHFKTMLESK
ncbi:MULTISPECIES: NAD(P)/FAD-dependent oxidoreductase [Oenococcus]|uniref:NADH dehydrogenase n=1 Tax=Oenococcus kitaharae DSM 17330 TaxID=1045004 RepID=G9WFV4_9LACO|nr:NAD(P)/FAD-dependent oxidoreductase [Oenococcus kitaharae]EHN59477.1 NADH dehydrogenase [Oenococcus kitaharae DSM 17330]OEY83339.1 pyridine nucleotide-disulfide oxidoreductase [Oenococcus kitaharae]OEY85137.1 pyridine nucleotide-disulfide oxidoreductase [Oenococcus kitaharae]OEY85992.1 pyridine nucleotide-disulfide oxidoreductase [Oenococcus kitaharae]